MCNPTSAWLRESYFLLLDAAVEMLHTPAEAGDRMQRGVRIDGEEEQDGR